MDNNKKNTKKKSTASIKTKKTVNTADVTVILVIAFCLIGIFCRGAIVDEAKNAANRDEVVISLYAGEIDPSAEKGMTADMPLFVDGNELGVLCDGWSVRSVEQTDENDNGERVSEKIDLKCKARLTGINTDKGFLLPCGRIIRVNDKIKIGGRGFEFEAVITEIGTE